ncbi:hypothetical protein [Epilithonimonas sp. UC225_85]|uniref:hypothetical protein n=1 Tax=Epilithonimonas sp. UC225_85 TaxID=3350167 RepID=UPI0036D29831
MSLQEIKQKALGNWKSIAVEVRPSAFKNEDGTLKPFYLKREFSYLPEDQFQLEIINFADAYGKIPVVKLVLKGKVEWKGDHPIADCTQKVDFTADEAYEVTPLIQDFTDLLNNLAKDGFKHWETGKSQSILKKIFVPFGLREGDIFKEYDLIYLYNDMMFWGARNVDGRGFDTEENRPANLQIPMVRT